jgi:hypothetical protein
MTAPSRELPEAVTAPPSREELAGRLADVQASTSTT